MSEPIALIVCAHCGRSVPQSIYQHICDGAVTGDMGQTFMFGVAEGQVCEYCGRLCSIKQYHFCPGAPRSPG